jgi:hypothetical protein
MDKNKNGSEITLRKDKEWSSIDSELCRITDFTPLNGSTVKGGEAISPVTTEPYASVTIECKKYLNKVTGFITHKIDFINLWTAFREREIGESEEVLIYWTTKHYKSKMLGMFSVALPKIIVMVHEKGAYERGLNNKDNVCGKFGMGSNCKLPTEENAQAFIYSSMPIIFWIPDIMKENLK